MLPYDVVIFDLDGTLTDSQLGIRRCTEYALQRMGLPMPNEETVRRFMGPPLAESFMRYCGMTEQEAARATDLYRERYIPVGWKENSVFPLIRPLLAALKARGAYVAVATGKPRHTSVDILRYFGLLDYLDAVAGPTDQELHADKADLIRRVLPASGRAVMVGDTAGDVKGASDVGIDSIAVLYGYGENAAILAAGPTRVAADTRALCDVLCPDMPPVKGCFVTLEGVDGCGKSTQAAALNERLTQFGYTVRRTREPGGCPIAEEIRKIVLAKEDGGMSPETEALLFAAARAQHVKDVILPAVQAGQIVLCDRFVDSSLVYQGMARGLDADWIKQINRAAYREGAPDATLYLRMGHADAMARRLAASDPDRIEQAGDSFHARTEAAYEQLLLENPDRFIPVDAAQTPEKVTEEAFAKLFARLKERGVL
ncbi:MAG: dTMP kinase [Clostridia bacterium]|nr:dTMP kinase [Clostridia bacterium]